MKYLTLKLYYSKNYLAKKNRCKNISDGNSYVETQSKC